MTLLTPDTFDTFDTITRGLPSWTVPLFLVSKLSFSHINYTYSLTLVGLIP